MCNDEICELLCYCLDILCLGNGLNDESRDLIKVIS